MGGAAKQQFSNGNRAAAEELVRNKGWLSTTPIGFQARLLGLAEIVRFAKGDTIFATGDPPGGLYGLVEGMLRVELQVATIGSQVSHIAYPGFWIGAGSALERKVREVTLTAGEASLLYYVPISGIETLARDPDSIRSLASLQTDNQRLILAAMRDLMNPNVPARIASRLLAVVGWQPRTPPPVEPLAITQSDLATICNVSRKTVNQALAKLGRLGLITQIYGGLFVNDPEGLQRIADGNERSRRPVDPSSTLRTPSNLA